MWRFEIENVAGIRAGKAKINYGTNIIQADNWQGKSSFITALQVAIGTTGSDGADHPLTEGTEDGGVRLETKTDTYNVSLVRGKTEVERNGETYLSTKQDRLCARLFACLGENNPIREVVRQDGNLAAELTKPLDIENIDQQISQLKRERNEVETELERATEAAADIPEIQKTITTLKAEIDELEQKRDDLDTQSTEVQTDPKQEKVSEKRARKEQLQNQIDTLVNKIERQENRLEQRKDELETLTVPDEPEELSNIDDKQDRIDELETKISLLTDLHRVNRRVLQEDKIELVTSVDRSLAGDTINCWLCNGETSESAIEARLEKMQEHIQEIRANKIELKTEIDEIQSQQKRFRQQKQKQTDLEAEISRIQVDLEENRSRLADLKETLGTVTEELETLSNELEATTNRLTEVESELKYKRRELEESRERLSKLETEAERQDRLREEYNELTAESERLRSRRKEKKLELAETFEETITDIIETFEPGFETARLIPKTDDSGTIADFDLVIARDGQETDLTALSEGEVELLGIVTALAGYETFNVDDRLPLILLDGLTALSSSNLGALVNYLRNDTERLVTTAYPENEDVDGHIISPGEWETVSDQQATKVH